MEPSCIVNNQRTGLAWQWCLAALVALGLFWSPGKAEAVCDTPNLLMVLDNSCSMGFNSNRNWNAATSAIRTITNSYKSKLRFGLENFNSGASVVYGIDRCIRDGANCVRNLQAALGRLRPTGGTNLIAAVQTAQSHLTAVRNADRVKARKQAVMFITDGQASCAQSYVLRLYQQLKVKTYVIGFGSGVSVACLNSMASSGGTARSGSRKYYQADNTTELNAAMKAIANAATAEVCNNLDDDCDGSVDEGLRRACSTACGPGTQTCSRGKWLACSASNPKPEICDGKDNDCDGKVDENWPTLNRSCTAGRGACLRTGKWVCNSARTNVQCTARAGSPTTEVCDGKDNDCDGQTDESLRRSCKTACGSGQETCSAGRWVNCNAPKPVAEKCNGKDDDCDGQIDENWSSKGKTCNVGVGACRNTGKWVCNSSGTGIQCSAKPGAPRTETCNGKDDDCDGRVDEDYSTLGRTCSGGTGACKQSGKIVCKPNGTGVQCSAQGGAPSAEVCDGKDNDCNGQVDENLSRSCKTACGSGMETCNAGKWEGCNAPKPSTETCNNKDDDCDGQTDEGLKRKCKTDCEEGQEVCNGGKWENCSARKPVKEDCNGKDDDCDGKVDNLAAKKCMSDCGEGLAVCQGGKWSGCSGPKPEKEVCDGKDNDCDGTIDNGLIKNCSNDCGSGFSACRAGKWGACSAPSPQQEVCDGKDNDCDGSIDNKAVCPSGSLCTNGQCQPKCRNGECPKGLKCVNDVCEGDACKNVQCSKDKQCIAGKCVDLCELLTCSNGDVCSNGRCVKNDCFLKGCPSGQRCVEGTCEGDPCDGVSCSSGEFCRDGKCIDSCAGVRCKSEELCKEGKCVPNPSTTGECAKVKCENGQICVKGKCVSNPCTGVKCPKGRVCQDGQCVGDPCLNIQCPAGEVCNEGNCFKPTDPGSGKNDGSTNPDGGTDPDGGTNPDGGSNPDGTTTLPDGRVVDNGGNGKPDGSGNPDSTSADRSTGTTGTNPDKPGGGAGPGCECSTTSNKIPAFPVFFALLFFAGLLIRRRR